MNTYKYKHRKYKYIYIYIYYLLYIIYLYLFIIYPLFNSTTNTHEVAIALESLWSLLRRALVTADTLGMGLHTRVDVFT